MSPADEPGVWLWIVGGLIAWLALAFPVAMLIGRSIRLADRQEAAGRAPRHADARRMAPAPSRTRRALPLPPVAIALLVATVALETTGFVLQSIGATGATTRLLTMNGTESVARLVVAALFAVTSVMAFAGAARVRERRAWWSSVGLVAGTIALVKFTNPVHAVDYQRLSGAMGSAGAALTVVLAAAGVAATLWLASRADQRDRRRVLGALGLYAVAALGAAAISTVVGGAYGYGSRWALAATYVEEAGQAVASVALLVAVLAGVAPRLVLPEDWVLRRSADAHTLEVAAPSISRADVHDATP